MKKLYPLSFARDDNVTCLKNSIEISGEIILRAFVEAAIVYSFLSEAASLLWRTYGGRSLCHGYGTVYSKLKNNRFSTLVWRQWYFLSWKKPFQFCFFNLIKYINIQWLTLHDKKAIYFPNNFSYSLVRL